MTILEKLSKNEILLSDGALGTFLHQLGMKPGECPELWNVTNRDKVLHVAQSYVLAGSEMITTNSFGGNIFKLSYYGLGDRVAELNRAAAEIVREAAGNKRHVAGSIGP